MLPNQTTLATAIRLFVIFTFGAAPIFPAKTPIYRWDPTNAFNTKQSALWLYTWDEAVNGALRCECRGTSQTQWYDMTYLANGSGAFNALQTGGNFTAEITFRIETPTIVPGYFYILARNSAGNQYDIWHPWAGDASSTFRTLSFPLDLVTLSNGTWNVRLGVVGKGALVISKYTIYSGNDEQVVAPLQNQGLKAPVPPLPLASGSPAFTILTPSGAGIYQATGMVADSPASATANAAAFLSSLSNCQSGGNHTLKIPMGKYWMAKPSALTLSAVTNLTLDGQGSTLVFSQQTSDGVAFYLSACSRVLFKNINLDWDWSVTPIASLGKVSQFHSNSCDFTFEDLNTTQTEKVRTTPWGKLYAMDPSSLTRCGSGLDFTLAGLALSSGGGQVLHATFNPLPGNTPLSNGYFLIRHTDYGMAGFKIYNSDHILFDQFTIFSFPGMGWTWGADSHHFGLKNSGVKRAPGSRTPLTTSRDGFHVMESLGNILLDNCYFSGAGDDLVNIHDRCYEAVLTPTGPNTATFENYGANMPLRVNPNDDLEFFNPDYSRLGASSSPVTRKVLSASLNGATGAYALTFSSALPNPLSPNAIVRNTRYHTSNVQIRNSHFYKANGHGILVSADNLTLENNLFENIYSTPLELEVNLVQNVIDYPGSWWEGDGASNVLIQNNQFDRVAQSGEFGGAVVYARTTLPCGPSSLSLFKRVTVANNLFLKARGPVVSLQNASGVVARQNLIADTDLTETYNHYPGMVLARRTDGLFVGGNLWLTRPSLPNPMALALDLTTTSGVTPSTNSRLLFTNASLETFENYTNLSAFSSGQSLGVADAQWAAPWRTASSYATTKASVQNTANLGEAKYLAVSVSTPSGLTAASGSISRPFRASGISQPIQIAFRIRPDTYPTNVSIVLSDGQIASATGGDNTASWLIVASNQTWHFFDGDAGGMGAFIDSGMPVNAGVIYKFDLVIDPTRHTWRAAVENGSRCAARSDLHGRSTVYATDTGSAQGGRWIIFGSREIVSGSSVGSMCQFSVDSIQIDY